MDIYLSKYSSAAYETFTGEYCYGLNSTRGKKDLLLGSTHYTSSIDVNALVENIDKFRRHGTIVMKGKFDTRLEPLLGDTSRNHAMAEFLWIECVSYFYYYFKISLLFPEISQERSAPHY